MSKFGKYRLIAELGHGGMADVFLAASSGPDGLGFTKLVVVKRLRQNLAEDPEFVAMLIDEARIAARLNHPNAVQTYEIGEVDGQYFISMEYLDGQPLSRFNVRSAKAGKPLALAHAVSIYADVLTGLHHAHTLADYDGTPLGIVHRDVTPHNIFVTYDGQVKIVDFGIAKAAGRASQTSQGVVKGKVVYMSPEQASAQDVDLRSDIFAAGVLLWETLTGERYWAGSDELGVMKRLIQRDLPKAPSSIRPDVPEALDKITMKALAPDREDRYANAELMASDLLDWLKVQGGRPMPREIGAGLAALFSDRREAAKEVIENQLASLSRSTEGQISLKRLNTTTTEAGLTPAAGKGLPPSVVGASRAPAAGDPDADTRIGSGPTSTPTVTASSFEKSQAAAAPKKRVNVVLMLGAVGVAAVVGLAIVKTQQRTVAAAPNPPTPPAMTVSSGTPPSTANGSSEPSIISVNLASDTPNVMFRIDDGPALAAPYDSRLPKSAVRHVVVATAQGCETARLETAFEIDLRWTPHLECGKHPGTNPVAGQVHQTTVAKPPDPPTDTAKPVIPVTPITPPAVTPSGRQPRIIDKDNPYGNK